MAKGVSVGISTFGVIGIFVIESVPGPESSSLDVGVELPGLPDRAALLPLWPFKNHNNPITTKISTMQPSNIIRRARFSIGFPENSLFAGLPIISGGKGASSLRVKTGH
jgi:hypothetical protein